jgi:hypothetical protein
LDSLKNHKSLKYVDSYKQVLVLIALFMLEMDSLGYAYVVPYSARPFCLITEQGLLEKLCIFDLYGSLFKLGEETGASLSSIQSGIGLGSIKKQKDAMKL